MMYHFFQTGMFPKIKVNIVKTNQEYSIVLPFLFIKQTNKIIFQIKLSERLKINIQRIPFNIIFLYTSPLHLLLTGGKRNISYSDKEINMRSDPI